MIDDIFSVVDEWLSDQQEDFYDDSYQLSLETNSSSILSSSFDHFIADNTWDIEDFSGVGDPLHDAQFWQQQLSQTSCAIVAQMGVYESIKGVELSEDAICDIAEINGWFDPRIGTSPTALGEILNAFGVETETQYDASLSDILFALEKGNKVIVALDANEIWNPLRDNSDKPIEQEDGGHAVWVTGIDRDDQGNIKIILNDSGISDGQMKVVNSIDFLNAWEDFGHHLVVAKNTNQLTLS